MFKCLDNLQLYLNQNLNCILVGKHGVGKSAVVIDLFNKKFGDEWLYLSGSTIDPFIDLCGVPLKCEDENGKPYLDFIRPKKLQEDKVQAIFCDEYNRCLSGDTLIKLVDGTSIQIKDLVNRKHFYVYAYDSQNQKIVVSKGHSARKTKINEQLYEVELDNGEIIKCTHDHPFLLKNGKYVKAIDLKINDSLMPLYTKFSDNLPIKGYEQVLQPNGKWEFTHHISDQYNLKNNIYDINDGVMRHHIDFNKLNNSPENLQRLSKENHLKIHQEKSFSKEECSLGGKTAHKVHPDLYSKTIGTQSSKDKALINSINTRKTSLSYKKLRSELSQQFFTEEERKTQSERAKQQWQTGQFDNIDKEERLVKTNINKTIRILLEELDGDLTKERYIEIQKDRTGKGYGINRIEYIENQFESFDNFINYFNESTKQINHTVVSIKKASIEDVYDITVDDYHNFALDSGIFVHNSPKKVRNALLEVIQFKSIQGYKFNNLKVVWAAVNPEEDKVYDVEALDPAQKDRFHIHIEMPYLLDSDFFLNKFGKDLSEGAIEWWNSLEKEVKESVSPRRLEYAIQVYNMKGNIKDVLPKNCNSQKLIENFKLGSLGTRVNNLLNENDVETLRKEVSNINIASYIQKNLKDNRFVQKFTEFLPEEMIVQEAPNNFDMCSHIKNNSNKFDTSLIGTLDKMDCFKESPFKDVFKIMHEVFDDGKYLSQRKNSMDKLMSHLPDPNTIKIRNSDISNIQQLMKLIELFIRGSQTRTVNKFNHKFNFIQKIYNLKLLNDANNLGLDFGSCYNLYRTLMDFEYRKNLEVNKAKAASQTGTIHTSASAIPGQQIPTTNPNHILQNTVYST